MLDFYRVPLSDPRRSRQGVYGYKDLAGGLVRVILLDNRYHRDSYALRENGDMLGETQWSWLKETLDSSTAQFNIIGNGLQILPNHFLRTTFGENWNRFPSSRAKLFRTIAQSPAGGVFLLSGDVHFAEFMAANCSCATPPFEWTLAEFTSSGLTHSWNTYPAIAGWGMAGAHRILDSDYATGQWLLDRNFGEMEFNDLGRPNASLVTRMIDFEGKVRFERVWTIKHLKPAQRGEECSCGAFNLPISALEQVARMICWLVVTVFPIFVFVLLCRLVRTFIRRWKAKKD